MPSNAQHPVCGPLANIKKTDHLPKSLLNDMIKTTLNATRILVRSVFIITIIFSLISCDSNYLHYLQHIETEDSDYNYSLYNDGVGIGDPGYYVLKLDKTINPKELYIKWNFRTGTDSKDIDWITKKQILFNYDEAGLFTQNPKIEIINDRFLVMSRGGFYFGLYDIKFQKDTFNIGSPWNNWISMSGYKSEKYDMEKEKALYLIGLRKI